VLSFFGNYFYIFELLSHFKLQYLLLFLLSIGFFSLFYRHRGYKKWLVISMIGFALNASVIFPIYLPEKITIRTDSRQFSLLLSNVLTSNQSKQKLIKLIQQQQADFVIALEVDRHWESGLKAIYSDYPYQSVIPRNDNFGIALYSKYPLENIQSIDFAKNGIPSISATVKLGGKEIQIIATHPLPPFNESFTLEQKLHFKALGKYVKGSENPIVVAGDLNTTVWSSAYDKLIALSNLKNTRQGYGIIPSWSVNSILQLPLDHVLISQQIQTVSIETMESIDSDHLPVYVQLFI
jgi:endonuclease/exonuclease/phosphatase (EEP) superfamily protein YafD